MKYKIFLILFFLVSCTTNFTKNDNRVPFNTKGFAYIYNKQDYQNKIIKFATEKAFKIFVFTERNKKDLRNQFFYFL